MTQTAFKLILFIRRRHVVLIVSAMLLSSPKSQLKTSLFMKAFFLQSEKNPKRLLVILWLSKFNDNREHIDQGYRELVPTIDYRCDYDLFPVPASCVTIFKPDSLFSSETGVDSGTRIWKSTYLNELDIWKPLVVSNSQRNEELRLRNLV
jgi:hypothetical protein